MVNVMTDVAELLAALAAPFDPDEIKWKPGTVSGSRALAMAYVDARVVMDRLDETVGANNWKDEYEFLDTGEVLCRLSLRIGGEWITKMDVGGMSEQKDEGDRRKSAVSDALKRTAVKFGVGRYLYRAKPIWVDYDPQKRQFKGTPQLPGTLASPAPKKAPRPAEGEKANLALEAEVERALRHVGEATDVESLTARYLQIKREQPIAADDPRVVRACAALKKVLQAKQEQPSA